MLGALGFRRLTANGSSLGPAVAAGHLVLSGPRNSLRDRAGGGLVQLAGYAGKAGNHVDFGFVFQFLAIV